MRYYATVQGGQKLALSVNAAEDIRQKVMSNLRLFRILTGFDYEGIIIGGVGLTASPKLTIEGVHKRLSASNDKVAKTRLIISPNRILDDTAQSGFELLLAIHDGDDYAWLSGEANTAAIITINSPQRSSKLTSTVVDIFQDIMIGNDQSIQSVISKFKDSGGSTDTFYKLKAKFATQRHSSHTHKILYDKFSPSNYASFSSIARRDLDLFPDDHSLKNLASIWIDFLNQELGDHFLNAKEATDLVRKGLFHPLKAERVGGEGPPANSRIQHGYLAEHDLMAIFSDPQMVTQNGSYVLCILNRTNGPDKDRLIAEFGQTSSRLKRLKLCTEDEYTRMVPLARRGLITPIRLFLKAPPRSA
ncbi:hypothetical protein [Caulobacter radicis]|uniref:hypothetical protein n=1 Tax=Caulobacter radicis TaxID=2172650 RepID=UPI001057FE0C|nr:hypothetical protein [Caulobacter radicis]